MYSVPFSKRITAELIPVHAAGRPMLELEVVGPHDVLIQAVSPVPRVANKPKEEIVLPDVLDGVEGFMFFPERFKRS
jgi:hypothetical protein